MLFHTNSKPIPLQTLATHSERHPVNHPPSLGIETNSIALAKPHHLLSDNPCAVAKQWKRGIDVGNRVVDV